MKSLTNFDPLVTLSNRPSACNDLLNGAPAVVGGAGAGVAFEELDPDRLGFTSRRMNIPMTRMISRRRIQRFVVFF